MKQIKGIWLPDDDTHFEEHLNKGPEFKGAGTYQYSKITQALACVKRYEVALDIGAHVGLWSRVLTHYFRRIYAFEPVPNHIICFLRNLREQIKHERVILIPIAIGNEQTDIYINTVTDNSGNAHVDNSGIKVSSKRIDDLEISSDRKSVV